MQLQVAGDFIPIIASSGFDFELIVKLLFWEACDRAGEARQAVVGLATRLAIL